MSHWYFQKDGEEVGPISAKQLVELADRGGIQPETLIRRSDMTQSIPAKEVEDLGVAIATYHHQISTTDSPEDVTSTTSTATAKHSKRAYIVVFIMFILILLFWGSCSDFSKQHEEQNNYAPPYNPYDKPPYNPNDRR